jgi:hypothetical protein
VCPSNLAKKVLLESTIHDHSNLSIEPDGYNENNNSICFTLVHKSGILNGVKVGVDINFVGIYQQKGLENVPMSVFNFPKAVRNACKKEAKKMSNGTYQSELLLCYMAMMKVLVIENLMRYYEENDLKGELDV